MPQTMTQPKRSQEVRTLDDVRPQMAHAGLRSPMQSDGVGSSDPIGRVAKDAVIKHYGTVKAAAYALGQVDPSLMVRELEAGKLSRLDVANDAPAVKSAVADAMGKAYGPLSDPKAHARKVLHDIEERLLELKQFVEDVA